MRARQLLCLLGLLITLGCSSIPDADVSAESYQEVKSRRLEAMDQSLAIAPVEVQIEGLGEEGFVKAEQVKPRLLQDQLQRWIGRSGRFSSSAPLTVKEGSSVDGEAWKGRHGLILEMTVTGLETRFDSHNLLWIPNMLVWAYAMFPAWWVATDRYRLDLEARLRVRLIDQSEPLLDESVESSVVGTFDEFDRGWRWFGAGALIGSALNARSNWERITQRLYPAAASLLAQNALVKLDAGLAPMLRSKEFEARARRVLSLSVGISRYADRQRYPRAPDHSKGAEAFVTASRARFGERTGGLLLDAQATRQAFVARLSAFLERVRDIDEGYLYFAGYVDEQGLVLHDAKGEQGRLSWSELAKQLQPLKGRGHLLLEVELKDLDAKALAKSLKALGVDVFVAARPGQAVSIPQGYEYGLFTRHVLGALAGRADANKDGLVSYRELVAYVSLRVESESGLYGAAQTPFAIAGSQTP